MGQSVTVWFDREADFLEVIPFWNNKVTLVNSELTVGWALPILQSVTPSKKIGGLEDYFRGKIGRQEVARSRNSFKYF